MDPSSFIAAPDAVCVAIVRALSPLAADLTMRCGGFEVPVAVVASATSLEEEDSEAGRVVRDFLAEDPWAGMGSVRPGGWMLLARDRDTIVVGQRQRRVGLGSVVVLERCQGRFEARSMGGWRLSSRDPGEQVEGFFVASVDGVALVVEWQRGQDLVGVPARVAARWEVLETETAVHLLLMSVSNLDPPQSVVGWSVGTGGSAMAIVELREPLGHRALFNDFRIPAQQIAVTPNRNR